MPIVGEQINKQFANDDFFFDFFSDLKLGFFHPNIGEKKLFDIGYITVKQPKISPANRLLSKYMKQTIIMSRMEHIFYLNRVTLL